MLRQGVLPIPAISLSTNKFSKAKLWREFPETAWAKDVSSGSFDARSSLKFMGDGRAQIAAYSIPDLENVPAAGFIPLMRLNRHLQNLALAMWIGAAFRQVLRCRFRLGSNFL